MPTIRDARSAAQLGMARAADWADQFQAEWTAPDAEAQLVQWWLSIPAEVHQQLAIMHPEDHGKMVKFIQSIQERYQWQK